MATTDTQQTAQFAAEASVSAAEAKQYLIEVQQDYQDISATTQEAINAATAAEAAKSAAETAEQNSSTSAAASSESATAAAGSAAQAEEYANNASDYAQNKFTFYVTASDPDGTIAGLAATTNGQSFRVAQGVDGTDAFITYQNDNGVAVAQAAQPGTAAITSTVRAYSTLSLAENDVASGNILAGSKCWVADPSDINLADEYINNGGTLEATGRRMPSYDLVAAISQAVTAEVMARTGLIFGSDDQTMLSLCDEWGYEAGRITENSFETRKLRLIQSETGPLLTLVDDFGYAVNLFSERGALVAGNNELSDSESLISLLDEFGNELILVDKQGRLYAGDNIIFDAPDWARCTVDPFGYVIEGVKLNGDVVSKNGGGGSVEPVPSVLENSAAAHWLFGYESTSYASRVGQKTLTPQSAPEFNTNYISVAPWGGALLTDIPDSGEYTACAVVRIPEQAAQTDSVVIYGTQNGYVLRDDDDTYTGNQLSLFSDREDRRWIRSKISGYRGTSRHYPTLQPPVGQWLFIAHVVKLTGKGERFQVISVSGNDYQVLREADDDRLILSGRNIAIGNGWCDNAMFKTKNLDIAEFIYFDQALSAQHIKDVYLNSRQRMSERALNLQ